MAAMDLPRLRPMEFGDILDGAFKLYRAEFVRLFSTALLINIPNLLFEFWVGAEAGSTDPTAALGVLVLRMPLSMLTLALLYAALFYQADRALHGTPVGAGESLRAGIGRFLPLLATYLIMSGAIIVGTLFLVVPGVIVALMFFAASPVVVLEGRGPVDALTRSRDLSRGALGHIAGVLIVSTIITILPGIALGMVGVVVGGMQAASGGDPGMALLVLRAAQVLASALITPFYVGVLLLLYYDRRIRSEAFDVQLAAERLGTSAAV
jgi:hypothetical protein